MGQFLDPKLAKLSDQELSQAAMQYLYPAVKQMCDSFGITTSQVWQGVLKGILDAKQELIQNRKAIESIPHRDH